MRKVFLLCLFLVIALYQGVQAQDAQQDFTVVNETGLSIDQLYVSATESNEWGEDVLGKDVLANDEECDIVFHPKEDICMWDIKIVDEEGDEVEWEKIDLCKALKVTLYWKDGKAWADIENIQE